MSDLDSRSGGDEILSRATRALRETGDPPPSDVARTRARVMQSARVGQRRRSRVALVAFPIAAVLVATTAWAASTGRLGAAVRGVRALFEEPAATAPPPVAPPVTVATAPRPPAPEPQRPPDPEPEPKPEPAAPPPPVTASAPKPQIAKPDAEVDDASSADLALYKRAHQLHFNDKDYARALDAWDEYLRGSPGGAFVYEARYNRAICLVKLGRRAEARVALQPFADGKIAGGYRQQEAQKLIDALE